jgi:hypothetical protein
MAVAALATVSSAAAAGASKPAQLRDGEVRHSGSVVTVDIDARRLRMEEMVAWMGPGTGIVERSVTVTPDTSIELIWRDDDPDRTALPGWDGKSIALRDIRRGDFVTVTVRRDNPVAVSLQVLRPDAP